MNNIFVILPAIAILLSATIPMAFASSHESNSKRSSDGFNDGSNEQEAIRRLILHAIHKVSILVTGNIPRLIVTLGLTDIQVRGIA